MMEQRAFGRIFRGESPSDIAALIFAFESSNAFKFMTLKQLNDANTWPDTEFAECCVCGVAFRISEVEAEMGEPKLCSEKCARRFGS